MQTGDRQEDPRIGRSRAVILPVATEHFLDKGYAATSLDEIADAARVSKRTIYNVVGDKERLFRTILEGSLETADRFVNDVSEFLEEADDVEAALHEVAARLAGVVLSDDVIRLRRLLIGEARRFPDIAADYYERAPARVMRTIADAIDRFGRRGLLEIDDPPVASEHFCFLTIGARLDRHLFSGDDRALRLDVVEDRARRGVDAFLRAYRPTRRPRERARPRRVAAGS